MGFFRGGLLFFFCILLFISLLAANSFLTLSTSLKYENIQKEIPPLVNELSDEKNNFFESMGMEDFKFDQATNQTQEAMRRYCQNNTEYAFTFDRYAVSIPCSSLEAGNEAILNEIIKDIVTQTYYQEYDCGFWSCLVQDEAPFFLVSEQAKDYWKGKFYLFLIISLVLVGLIFFLIENKLNWPVLVGSVLIISAIPLLKIKGILAFFIPESFRALSIFLNIFFSKAELVFWIVFILGLILIGIGLGLRFSNADFVKKFTDKEEVQKVKKK